MSASTAQVSVGGFQPDGGEQGRKMGREVAAQGI